MDLQSIERLLGQHMTERGFKFWTALKEKIPPAWDRLASSTKRYHKKANGRVPSIAEHTFEMLYSAVNLLRMFDVDSQTPEADMILLSIVLHDAFKYGLNPDSSDYTTPKHDRIMAESVVANRDQFLKVFSESQVDQIESAIRYHAGRWASDATNTFRIENLDPITLFIHFLDMMSSRDLIKARRI